MDYAYLLLAVGVSVAVGLVGGVIVTRHKANAMYRQKINAIMGHSIRGSTAMANAFVDLYMKHNGVDRDTAARVLVDIMRKAGAPVAYINADDLPGSRKISGGHTGGPDCPECKRIEEEEAKRNVKH